MKRFIFNSLLDAENICNLESETKKISDGIQNGLKMLIYGKRNTGKTSLIRNVIAKKWQQEVDGFFMYVDLMGVQDISQISERLMLAFSQTQIFAKPNAPFFSWGTHVSFLPIDYAVYSDYMNERFNQMNLNIDYDNAKYLQDLMSRNPEAINRLCYTLQHISDKGDITKDTIDMALEQLIQDRRSEPESYLSKFSMAEQSVITTLAFKEPILKPLGKVFVQQVGLSTTGVGKIIKKLENNAVVYKEDNGYVLADP